MEVTWELLCGQLDWCVSDYMWTTNSEHNSDCTLVGWLSWTHKLKQVIHSGWSTVGGTLRWLPFTSRLQTERFVIFPFLYLYRGCCRNTFAKGIPYIKKRLWICVSFSFLFSSLSYLLSLGWGTGGPQVECGQVWLLSSPPIFFNLKKCTQSSSYSIYD